MTKSYIAPRTVSSMVYSKWHYLPCHRIQCFTGAEMLGFRATLFGTEGHLRREAGSGPLAMKATTGWDGSRKELLPQAIGRARCQGSPAMHGDRPGKGPSTVAPLLPPLFSPWARTPPGASRRGPRQSCLPVIRNRG
jgi:hypothetical protein